jgi:natural product precursor
MNYKTINVMKKEKQLKLDTLSSSELANKEANQIIGGEATICYCTCYCNSAEERVFLRIDEKYSVSVDTQVEY